MARNVFIGSFIFLAVAFLFFFFAILPVKADVQQLTRSTELSATFNSGGTMRNTQTLGNGFDFELYEIAAWVKRTGGSGTWNFVLYECNENTYTTCAQVFNETGASTNTVAERLAMSATPTVILNPVKYYAFVMEIANGSGNQVSAFGSATDVYSGGAAVNSTAGLPAGTPNPSGTIADWYFEINGAPWWQIATSTYIRGGYTPTVGEITSSNTVTFTFDYFVNDTQTPPPAYVGIRVWNLTDGITYNTLESEELIVSSGAGSYSVQMVLPIGPAYSWQPYIRYSSNLFVNGYTSPFSVVEQNATSSPFTEVPTTDATASSTLLSLNSLFSWVDILSNKFPLNWITQSATIFYNLADSTSTTTVPEVTVNYGGLSLLQNIPTTTPINTEFTFFSAQTFDDVAEIPGMDTMRTLVSWVLWIGLITFVWREGGRLFKTREA